MSIIFGESDIAAPFVTPNEVENGAAGVAAT